MFSQADQNIRVNLHLFVLKWPLDLFLLLWFWQFLWWTPFFVFFLQAGWKESHATFMTELRNLQATGLTTIGQSLRNAFDLLNLNRLVTGIDNYGQVCSTEEVRFRADMVPTRTPFTSPVPFPCSQSYKHQPPTYCDPHTYNSNKWKDRSGIL